jgi:gamma-glutamyl:cysteine ligase YbdK (ATP-grasp superfamily)
MEKLKQEKRTNSQNSALHVYCQELANELNGAGVSMQAFVKDIQADHTMESVKSLWRAFAKAKYGKQSTTELTRREINDIYEEVNRHVSQWGIHIAWPSNEPPLLEEI